MTSLDTLEWNTGPTGKLAQEAGHWYIQPTTVETATMALRDDLHSRREMLVAIAARHGATSIRLFGSVARREEREDSDVDLLVDMAVHSG